MLPLSGGATTARAWRSIGNAGPLERLVRRADFATRTNASEAGFTIAERSRELEESRPRHPVAVSIHHHD